MNLSDQTPLDDLFWSDEILQIAYWYDGEGLGSEMSAEELRRLLAADAPPLDAHLARLCVDGFFEEASPGRYRLTATGRKEGGRRFADAFDGLTKPAHGECSADCACHTKGPEFCEHA